MKQEFFEIGQIVNTFGIKGFVKVNPYTDDITQFETLKTILIEKIVNNSIEQVSIVETNLYLKELIKYHYS